MTWHLRMGPAGSAMIPLLCAIALVAACTVPPANAGRDPKSRPGDAGAYAKASDAAEKASPRFAESGRRPVSDWLACKTDSDCEFFDQPCSCPPCEPTWRNVYNRKKVQQLKASWARKRCMREPCPKCADKWLGSKAVCERGQCEAR